MSVLVQPIAPSLSSATTTSFTVQPRDLVTSLADRLMPMTAAYIPGKTAIRDAVMTELDCSAAKAESLVDSLERDGFLEYVGSRSKINRGAGYWRFVSRPSRRRTVQRPASR